MKAVVIRHYGGPEVLEYGEFPDPVVGNGDVLVKVAAASINPIDIMERSGLTKDVSFPGVLGWDLSGTVVQVGPAVIGFSIGDKVLAWAYHTYAELCVVKAGLLAKVPDGLDLVEAAALPLVTTTGNQLVPVAAEIKPGQTVLVAGAFGGVGRSAAFTLRNWERGSSPAYWRSNLPRPKTRRRPSRRARRRGRVERACARGCGRQHSSGQDRGTASGKSEARRHVRFRHRRAGQGQ
jgi:D-arabinose 1-dehydrogenase-like Zn-dependent alcohol dehydrogenase